MVEFFSRAMVEFIGTGLIGIMVVITAYYAWTTSRILKANEGVLREMRLQRELETRPYIVVFPSILEGDSFIYLKIANHGKSAGQNLKLSLNKDVFSLGKKDRPLSEFAIFRQEIDSFPPNHEITYLLANGMEFFKSFPK